MVRSRGNAEKSDPPASPSTASALIHTPGDSVVADSTVTGVVQHVVEEVTKVNQEPISHSSTSQEKSASATQSPDSVGTVEKMEEEPKKAVSTSRRVDVNEDTYSTVSEFHEGEDMPMFSKITLDNKMILGPNSESAGRFNGPDMDIARYGIVHPMSPGDVAMFYHPYYHDTDVNVSVRPPGGIQIPGYDGYFYQLKHIAPQARDDDYRKLWVHQTLLVKKNTEQRTRPRLGPKGYDRPGPAFNNFPPGYVFYYHDQSYRNLQYLKFEQLYLAKKAVQKGSDCDPNNLGYSAVFVEEVDDLTPGAKAMAYHWIEARKDIEREERKQQRKKMSDKRSASKAGSKSDAQSDTSSKFCEKHVKKPQASGNALAGNLDPAEGRAMTSRFIDEVEDFQAVFAQKELLQNELESLKKELNSRATVADSVDSFGPHLEGLRDGLETVTAKLDGLAIFPSAKQFEELLVKIRLLPSAFDLQRLSTAIHEFIDEKTELGARLTAVDDRISRLKIAIVKLCKVKGLPPLIMSPNRDTAETESVFRYADQMDHDEKNDETGSEQVEMRPPEPSAMPPPHDPATPLPKPSAMPPPHEPATPLPGQLLQPHFPTAMTPQQQEGQNEDDDDVFLPDGQKNAGSLPLPKTVEDGKSSKRKRTVVEHPELETDQVDNAKRQKEDVPEQPIKKDRKQKEPKRLISKEFETTPDPAVKAGPPVKVQKKTVGDQQKIDRQKELKKSNQVETASVLSPIDVSKAVSPVKHLVDPKLFIPIPKKMKSSEKHAILDLGGSKKLKSSSFLTRDMSLAAKYSSKSTSKTGTKLATGLKAGASRTPPEIDRKRLKKELGSIIDNRGFKMLKAASCNRNKSSSELLDRLLADASESHKRFYCSVISDERPRRGTERSLENFVDNSHVFKSPEFERFMDAIRELFEDELVVEEDEFMAMKLMFWLTIDPDQLIDEDLLDCFSDFLDYAHEVVSNPHAMPSQMAIRKWQPIPPPPAPTPKAETGPPKKKVKTARDMIADIKKKGIQSKSAATIPKAVKSHEGTTESPSTKGRQPLKKAELQPMSPKKTAPTTSSTKQLPRKSASKEPPKSPIKLPPKSASRAPPKSASRAPPKSASKAPPKSTSTKKTEPKTKAKKPPPYTLRRPKKSDSESSSEDDDQDEQGVVNKGEPKIPKAKKQTILIGESWFESCIEKGKTVYKPVEQPSNDGEEDEDDDDMQQSGDESSFENSTQEERQLTRNILLQHFTEQELQDICTAAREKIVRKTEGVVPKVKWGFLTAIRTLCDKIENKTMNDFKVEMLDLVKGMKKLKRYGSQIRFLSGKTPVYGHLVRMVVGEVKPCKRELTNLPKLCLQRVNTFVNMGIHRGPKVAPAVPKVAVPKEEEEEEGVESGDEQGSDVGGDDPGTVQPQDGDVSETGNESDDEPSYPIPFAEEKVHHLYPFQRNVNADLSAHEMLYAVVRQPIDDDQVQTMLSLIEYLLENLTYYCGTLAVCRQLPDKFTALVTHAGEKMTRGMVKFLHWGKITLSLWLDSKSVVIASSLPHIVDEMSSCKRVVYSSETDKWEKKEIPCPVVVEEYNKYMSGVDRVDQVLAAYHVHIRQQKWFMCIWFRLIEMAVINAHILYKYTFPGTRLANSMLDFQWAVIEGLTQLADRMDDPDAQRERFDIYFPDDEDYDLDRPIAPLTPLDLRSMRFYYKSAAGRRIMDKLRFNRNSAHTPHYATIRRRCVCCGGNYRTNICCSYCKVCLHPGRCYERFHKRVVFKY